jgi:ABC-2 type transport system ATP-binding protein
MSADNQDKYAINVDGVNKDFVLPHERSQSVKQAFTGLFKSKDKSAETQHALQNITFNVKEGEFFGIVGRNGSGKSTLLKILAGIYQPTKGTVDVRGKLVPFIELGVGFNPELTGRENVFLNCALLGFSPKEVQGMYHKIVAFAELARFMDQKLKNYSSGMQVRLAFSVAIVAEADILLVDEVLAVGDADFQRKCFEYFKSLKKQKKTVIFVTHDMSAVREYCDRAILVDRSKLVAEGSADEIAERYTRLFTETDESEATAKTGKRWGNEEATITKVTTDKRTYGDDDKTVVLTTEFVANKDLDNPVVGALVKDAADNHLFGTNTLIKNIRIGKIAKGEHVRLQWTMPNIFADGRHYVDVAVQLSDAITVCDWWSEATNFTVRKAERTAYPITPQVDVERIK